jgi:hypothetical protein
MECKNSLAKLGKLAFSRLITGIVTFKVEQNYGVKSTSVKEGTRAGENPASHFF